MVEVTISIISSLIFYFSQIASSFLSKQGATRHTKISFLSQLNEFDKIFLNKMAANN